MKTDPRVALRRCKCRRVHHIDTRHHITTVICQCGATIWHRPTQGHTA